MTELHQAFRTVMRELRHRRQWTQRDLTREGRFGSSFIAMLENGTYLPSLQTLAKLSNLLGVSLEEFGRLLDVALKTARGSEPTGRLGAEESSVSSHLHDAPSSIGSQGGARNTQISGELCPSSAAVDAHRAGFPTPIEIDHGRSAT